ncbi:MAG: DNA polymerase Y family protein [Pseudomonadota bacterium]|nr:DNA polymerase Y family protein [Pseudomonadota bacterium]
MDAGAALAVVATHNNARRLVSVDVQAERLGLSAGLTLADARARHPALVAVEADPAAQALALERLADASSRYTPLVALDGADALMLDVAGVAHLFGGEAGLIADAESRFARARLTLRAGLADTPRAAAALARFGRLACAPAGLEGKAFAKLFHDMPVAALGIAPALTGELSRAGLKRIGDLALRPRAPIAARFGADLIARLDELHGASRPSISPRFAAPDVLAERRFASPIQHWQAVEATLNRLADDLVVLLERRRQGARKLELALFRVDGAAWRLRIAASRPLNEARAIVRLFQERLRHGEPIDPGFGIDLMRLSCLLAEDAAPSQHAFERAFEETQAKNLADLIDRLGARLGPSRVTRQTLVDAHLPEQSFLSRPAAKGPPPPGALEIPERPLKLFERPEPIEALAEVPDGPPLRFRWRRVLREVAAIEGPERIAPPWWRGPSGPTRDYFRAEDSFGRRYWLYREGFYGADARPRWFLHGLFG